MIQDNQKLEDDLAPVSMVAKNGYYRVGDKNYNYKINALEAATRGNQPVEWEFNNAVFRQLNWRQPTGCSLPELYRIRAQQLRDSYDYLVLAFSGGGDSYNVLRSFLDNNIPLDEIICDWPLRQTEQQTVTDSKDPTNYLNEWTLSIKPVLEQVAQTHPNIKITVTDSLQRLTMEDLEDTCTITQIHNYVSIKRYRLIDERLKKLEQDHNRVALILGIEKPDMLIKYNVFGVYFSDTHCWYKSSITDHCRNVEYFYWSPDLPEIVIAQAQTLYKYVKQNPQWISWLSADEPTDPLQLHVRRKTIRDTTRSLLYPGWNYSLFQADKGTNLIYNEQYQWFFEKEKTLEIQSWESSMYSRLKMIDPQYLCFFNDGRFKGYRQITSRLYPVGVV